MKALSRSSFCSCPTTRSGPRTTTDDIIDLKPEELEAVRNQIRNQLSGIERTLGTIFGDSYSRRPASLKTRADAADLIEGHFDGIVQQWVDDVAQLRVEKSSNGNPPPHHSYNPDFSNALIRFIAHLRDPDDIDTYIYLRKHCQQGMLARMGPGQFNLVHIMLKQVLLNHVRSTLNGTKMEAVRDAIVASVDERRLMVSQFYIESREQALRASEEKYRNAINHAPSVMYEIDVENGRILAANSAAERLTGLAPRTEIKSPVGQKITDVVPEEMKAMTMEHFKQVLIKGSSHDHDVPLYGRYFDIHSALIPYGNKQFIQTILNDVTQRREMLTELLKAERLAATGTFAAGVAHEVNNPLASISSLVQSLVSAETDSSRRMTLHTILSQINRISTTLKDLMNFARPTTVQRKQIDVNALVAETMRLVGYNKRFSGVKLEAKPAPDLLPVFADENEIQQVLLNLLFNAADASSAPGAAIRVETGNKGKPSNGDRQEFVFVRVIDNGIGIPREHLERVFDPFFTTKAAGTGVGLGLSLCQRIILGNGGSIKLDSELGKGTTVSIYLPAYRPELNVSAVSAVQ